MRRHTIRGKRKITEAALADISSSRRSRGTASSRRTAWPTDQGAVDGSPGNTQAALEDYCATLEDMPGNELTRRANRSTRQTKPRRKEIPDYEEEQWGRPCWRRHRCGRSSGFATIGVVGSSSGVC